MPRWLDRWIERTGHIPWIVWKLWPRTHFCPEMDDMLVSDDCASSCFCGVYPVCDRCGVAFADRERHVCSDLDFELAAF